MRPRARNRWAAAHALWALVRIGTPEAQGGPGLRGEACRWPGSPAGGQPACAATGCPPPGRWPGSWGRTTTPPSASRRPWRCPNRPRCARPWSTCWSGGCRPPVHRYEAAGTWPGVPTPRADPTLHVETGTRLAGLIALDVACFEGLPGAARVAGGWLLPWATRSGRARPAADLGPARLGQARRPRWKSCVRGTPAGGGDAQVLFLLRANSAPLDHGAGGRGQTVAGGGRQGSVELGSRPRRLSGVAGGRGADGDGASNWADCSGRGWWSGPGPTPWPGGWGPRPCRWPARWPRAADGRVAVEERADLLATLARVEAKPDRERWDRLLGRPGRGHPHRGLRRRRLQGGWRWSRRSWGVPPSC